MKKLKQKKQSGKSTLTVIKDKLSLEDWRAALSITVTIGGLAIIFWSLQYGKDVVVAVTPPVCALIMIVLDWYFKRKEHEQ